MYGTSEISVSFLLTLKHLAGSPTDTDDFFLVGVCEFILLFFLFHTPPRSRDSSRIFSNCSAPNSEKRLLINLAYRAPANSSGTPVSALLDSAWEFDPALLIFSY